MERQGGFISTAILLIITALIATTALSGAAVWQKMTSPTPTTTSTLNPTPTVKLQPTVGGPVNPGIFKGDLRNLPTSTPPPKISPFLGSPGAIRITSSKTAYSRGETVEIKVVNNSQQALSYIYGPGCDLGFEQKIDSNWQPADFCFMCGSAAPCVTTTLAPGGSFQTKEPINSRATAGTYRASFHYINGTIYSNEFQIR